MEDNTHTPRALIESMVRLNEHDAQEVLDNATRVYWQYKDRGLSELREALVKLRARYLEGRTPSLAILGDAYAIAVCVAILEGYGRDRAGLMAVGILASWERVRALWRGGLC